MLAFSRILAASLVCLPIFFLAPVVACAQSTPYFSGTVRDGSNQPLAGVAIEAGHVDFQIWGNFTVDGQAVTNAQGQYAITTLGAGDGSGNYVLIARLAGHITEVYPDTPCYYQNSCPGNFPPVVAAPDTTADFLLFLPASISGHITRSDTNVPVCCINVQLIRNNSTSFYAQSDTAGKYTVSGILPGSYAAVVSDFQLPDLLLQQSYAGHDYDSTMNGYAGSDAFALQDGQDLQGIDFSLHLGAAFSGVITSAIDGSAIATDVSVRRHTPFDSTSYLSTSSSAKYGEQNPGSYVSSAFLPGNFSVFFGRGNLFAPQYFAGAAFEANAQEIVLTSGQVVTGIDAQMTTMQSIAGIVTNANTGQPMPGVIVHSGLMVGFQLADYVDTITDAAGHYLLQGLGPTSGQNRYYVWVASEPGYMDTFYPNITTTGCCFAPPPGAQALQLGASQQLTGMDFVLSAGAYASGSVYDADTGFAAPAYLQVELMDTSGMSVQSTWTDGTGHYSTDAVPVGSYYLAANAATYSFYYPNYLCTSNCNLANAQLQNFTATQKYTLDLAIPHLDLIFRGSFDQ